MDMGLIFRFRHRESECGFTIDQDSSEERTWNRIDESN